MAKQKKKTTTLFIVGQTAPLAAFFKQDIAEKFATTLNENSCNSLTAVTAHPIEVTTAQAFAKEEEARFLSQLTDEARAVLLRVRRKRTASATVPATGNAAA